MNNLKTLNTYAFILPLTCFLSIFNTNFVKTIFLTGRNDKKYGNNEKLNERLILSRSSLLLRYFNFTQSFCNGEKTYIKGYLFN